MMMYSIHIPFSAMRKAAFVKLPMAITKNIVDMMGGTITVKSEEGKGSPGTVRSDPDGYDL